jgi:NAD(P)-dependent dehydrogenase (short-subunit alcohol dehydrogenase family)
MDEWDWHRVLDVNLTGAFLMTQSVGRGMRARGSGVIVNLTTESARDESAEAAYLASMQGLAEFTRQAARELSPYGIRVYLVENAAEKVVRSVFALFDLKTEE